MIAPMMIGAAQNSQSSTTQTPPANKAGPVLRAGLTEVFVTGIDTRWMSVSPSPIGMPAKPLAVSFAPPRHASAPDYRDGAVVEGVVVSTGTALEGAPGRAGVVTEAPETPGIATLVPAALAAPGTVVAVPGTAAAVPGTPETLPVMSFTPGTIVVAPGVPGSEVVTPCAPGTDAAAPAAPGIAPVVAAPGTEGVIWDFAPSRRTFSPSFKAFCARACEHAAAMPMAAIVQATAGFMRSGLP